MLVMIVTLRFNVEHIPLVMLSLAVNTTAHAVGVSVYVSFASLPDKVADVH